MQMSLWAATPGGTFSFAHITHPLLQLTMQTLEVMSISFVTWPQASSKGEPVRLSDELLQLQEIMNMALEQLLTNRATRDFCCKELDLNMELATHLNDAQATEAIKEAEVCHATTACVLQQAHRDSVLVLEHEEKVEEGQDHQAFVEAFGAAIQACLPKINGALLYPLQLLTGDVPLATILGMSATTQLPAIADRGPVLAASIPSISDTITPSGHKMLVPFLRPRCPHPKAG